MPKYGSSIKLIIMQSVHNYAGLASLYISIPIQSQVPLNILVYSF